MIALRELRPDDEARLLQWRNLPEVAGYMYTDHVITPEEHHAWFTRLPHARDTKYWVVELDGEPVGAAQLTNIDEHNRRCYWGFYLASPNIRGRGVGAFVEYFILCYVFETLQLNKLCGEVLSFNTAVVKMHKRFGFKEEGLLREHVFKGGEKHDVVTIGLLRSEFEELKPALTQVLKDRGIL